MYCFYNIAKKHEHACQWWVDIERNDHGVLSWIQDGDSEESITSYLLQEIDFLSLTSLDKVKIGCRVFPLGMLWKLEKGEDYRGYTCFLLVLNLWSGSLYFLNCPQLLLRNSMVKATLNTMSQRRNYIVICLCVVLFAGFVVISGEIFLKIEIIYLQNIRKQN